MAIRVIIADDRRMMREGLRSLLEKQPGIEVIADVPDGRTAVELAINQTPDVVVMDITMPDMNGIEAARQIIEKSPSVKIIALSIHSDKRFIIEMLNAGASGYVLKDCAAQELFDALQTVVRNRTYLSPDIAEIMIGEYRHIISKNSLSAFSILTVRERQVLQLIAEGRTTKEIAHALEVSIKTVETYRQKVMDKLNIRSIAGLTKYAVREGLTPF